MENQAVYARLAGAMDSNEVPSPARNEEGDVLRYIGFGIRKIKDEDLRWSMGPQQLQ